MDLTIRKWRIDDKSDLAIILNNPKVLNNLRDGLPYPYTENDANVVPCYDLLIGTSGERVASRKVCQYHPLTVPFAFALFLVYRFARPVANVLMGAGHHIEDRRLAGVGLTQQGNDRRSVVLSVKLAAAMVSAVFAGCAGFTTAHCSAPPTMIFLLSSRPMATRVSLAKSRTGCFL